MKVYSVKPISAQQQPLTWNAESWTSADLVVDFCYPWEPEFPPPMRFRALHDPNWLYLRYDVEDGVPLVYVAKNAKPEILQSDRVEIFFRKDERMNPYYCLEVDPLARVYDYQAVYHRQFNVQWFWPADQLQASSHQTQEGYVVTLAVSKKSLMDFGLLDGGRLQVGLFRGKCVAIHPDESEMKWISWVEPDSTTPDFHIPSAFGSFELL